VRQKYRDFGPTLAAEVLLERHGVAISRETLRKWMVEDGLWLSRKQRRTFHQPRLLHGSYGDSVQIDGSEYSWLEGRGEPCTLLVFPREFRISAEPFVTGTRSALASNNILHRSHHDDWLNGGYRSPLPGRAR